MELIDRHELIRRSIKVGKTKKKSKILVDFRKDAEVLMPYIRNCIDTGKGMSLKEAYDEFGFSKKYGDPTTIYTYLRYTLFFDDIKVSKEILDGQDYLFFQAGRGNKISKAVISMLERFDLDNWYIKHNRRGVLGAKFSLMRYGYGTYLLKSDGDIYFDERLVTEEQAVDLVKYLSSGGGVVRMPDIVRNTPINICLPHNMTFSGIDFDDVGREFRIGPSTSCEVIRAGRVHGDDIYIHLDMDDEHGTGFDLTTIYGKSWPVTEHDIDRLLLDGSANSILSNYRFITEIERLPETIAIIKKIILDMGIEKLKGFVSIDENNRLIIVNNRWGTFHLSLLDGSLYKILIKDNDSSGNVDNVDNVVNVGNAGSKRMKRYICVNPREPVGGLLIDKGVQKEVSVVVNRVLSKLIMLLSDRYPDEITRRQIEYK